MIIDLRQARDGGHGNHANALDPDWHRAAMVGMVCRIKPMFCKAFAFLSVPGADQKRCRLKA